MAIFFFCFSLLFLHGVGGSSRPGPGPLQYPHCRIAKGLPKLYNCHLAFSVSTEGFLNESLHQSPSHQIGYIVKLKDGLSPTTIERICVKAESKGTTYEGKCIRRFESVWLGMLIMMSGHHLTQLLREEAETIEYAEVEGEFQLSFTQLDPPWGLDRIDHIAGQIDLNNLYNVSMTGTGVHVYVLDTGIRCTHTEFLYLDGRVDSKQVPMSRCLEGFDAINDGKGINDCHGHGTHCAGIIAGIKSGVAKNAFVHPIRVMSCDGTGRLGAILSGMDWIYRNKVLPAVLSMSITTSPSLSIDDAVNRIINKTGIVTVAASGNFLQSSCNYSPSRASGVISVASCNSDNEMSWFSDYGNCTSIFAPGEFIPSSFKDSDTSFETLSGTSMACPHVSGAAALFLENNVNARASEVKQALLDASELNAVAKVKEDTTTRLLNVFNLDDQVVEIKPRSFYNATEGMTYKVIVRLIYKPRYPVMMTPSFSDPTIGVFKPSRLIFSVDTKWSLSQVINIELKKNPDFFDHESIINWDFASQDATYLTSFEGYIVSQDKDICRYTPQNPCGQNVNNPKIIPTIPFFYYDDTFFYDDDYNASFDSSLSFGSDVVFQYTAKKNMIVSISLCGKDSTFDTILVVYQKIKFIAGKWIMLRLFYNDDYCNVQSALPIVPLLKGQTYIIIVDGYNGEKGGFDFSIDLC